MWETHISGVRSEGEVLTGKGTHRDVFFLQHVKIGLSSAFWVLTDPRPYAVALNHVSFSRTGCQASELAVLSVVDLGGQPRAMGNDIRYWSHSGE